MMTDSDLEKTMATAVSKVNTAKVARLYRLGTRRVTRAHVALQWRPQLGQALSAVVPQVAQALGAQLGCPVEVAASLVDTTCQLDRHLGRDGALVLLELDAAGAPAVLELERPVLGAALSRLSGGSARPAPSSRLTRIEEAAFGFLSLLALQALRQDATVEQRLSPRIKAVNASRDEAALHADPKAAHLCVKLLVSVGGVAGQGRLFVPARAIQSAVAGDAIVRDGELPQELAAAELTLRSFVGRTVLDSHDLTALHGGDVVMFDGISLADGRVHGDARFSSRGFELFGALDAEGFHLSRVFARVFPQESSMSQPIEKDDPPSLPVEVEIELTRLRLSVGELASIRPGSILPLHINSAEPVLLRVGDRAVARAELVEIEGEVGARILALLS